MPKRPEIKEVLCELSDHPQGYLLEVAMTLRGGKVVKFVRVLRNSSFILNFDTLDDVPSSEGGKGNATLPN